MRYLTIFVLLIFCQILYGQDLIYKKGVYLVSKPSLYNKVEKPSENSESIKILNKVQKDSTRYTIYVKEYKDQKHIPDLFDMINTRYANAGQTISWVLTPDTSIQKLVKIFSFYSSGVMALRQRAIIENNKFFDYRFFSYEENLVYDEEVPLLVIFESAKNDNLNKQLVLKENIKQKGYLDPKRKQEILSMFNRYILVYYIATLY